MATISWHSSVNAYESAANPRTIVTVAIDQSSEMYRHKPVRFANRLTASTAVARKRLFVLGNAVATASTGLFARAWHPAESPESAIRAVDAPTLPGTSQTRLSQDHRAAGERPSRTDFRVDFASGDTAREYQPPGRFVNFRTGGLSVANCTRSTGAIRRLRESSAAIDSRP